MRFLETGIQGAKLIEATLRHDARGRFMRAWCYREFVEHDIDFVPVQENCGFSTSSGTIRGMHFQVAPAGEAKLVRCTKGRMFDVVLDLRRESSTYGNWWGVELSDEDGRMLYLPVGCAHGYQTLESGTEMYYMTSAYYSPDAVRGVRFDDPAFSIEWPLPVTVVSEQDRKWPLVERCAETGAPRRDPYSPSNSPADRGRIYHGD